MTWFSRKREQAQAPKPSVFQRLKEGLGKSSSKLTQGVADIFTKRRLDAQAARELEDLLITADLGPATAARIVAEISRSRFDKDVTPGEVRAALAEEIAKILAPCEKPLRAEGAKPFVILMAGVNGTGKTTTIGKLAAQFRAAGKSVMLAAGDTFRAAAVEQLKIWGERAGCPVVAKEEGADAAALAFEAVDRALCENADVLMIDTAGRLQNQQNLMAELEKIVRVIGKKIPGAPHATLLVLDATTGQNAHAQVEMFRKAVDVTGLIVTKLDGTAKGGVVVGLAEKFGLPVHAVGVGEGVEDLQPFSARDYAAGITDA